MIRNRVLRATSNPGVIADFPSRPRAPRPLKNPLLHPLQLYRLILRTHRTTLPPHLRTIGDAYVKSEFKLHKSTENPIHIIGFLSEWQNYAQMLGGREWMGKEIDKDVIDRMSDEQVGQLYALMKASREDLDAQAAEETSALIDKITKKS
ncbi:putative ACN9 family domain containing protein [Taphrina deformans PYCC 5710]|uniref:Succinate dehydrogenase assembly factor 3 n=1 Tax=Taphrina deformans (strain PYCC 5710 / ATCC 11124 / CBS 356.35 / IMI 108563 / JCM 9778 / NBRC 8474) TaxID=1097556 RepID=R4XLD3_TAPDE|nr:putative ACN9 family domain containing protein [Taphrina deformans PYCC 5710]|eukprot:CCG85170.1 putative ACN9 family domain containing protein [Taphrina deformans PYCC 5710]